MDNVKNVVAMRAFGMRTTSTECMAAAAVSGCGILRVHQPPILLPSCTMASAWFAWKRAFLACGLYCRNAAVVVQLLAYL